MYVLLVFLAVGFALLLYFNYQANREQMAAIHAAEEAASVTPTPPPTETPAPTAEPTRNAETFTLAFAGDLLGQAGLTTDVETTGDDGSVSYDYGQELAGVQSALEGAKISACTLVSTVTDQGGYDAYRMPAAVASALSGAGFQIVNAATDHILDYELTGLTDTWRILSGAGITPAGIYASGESRALPVATVNGVKVAYLSYTYGTRGTSVADNSWCVDILTEDYMTGQSTLDYARIDADIAAVKQAGADVIVCFVYWWEDTQYFTEPRDKQVQAVDYLCQKGVDVLIGGGVKCPQPIETRTVEREDGSLANCVICYSLSNLMSAFNDQYTNISAAVQVEVSRDADDGSVWVSGVTAYPLFMLDTDDYSDYDEPGFKYRLLDARSAAADYEAGAQTPLSAEAYGALTTGVTDLETLMGAEYFVQNGGVALSYPYEATNGASE